LEEERSVPQLGDCQQVVGDAELPKNIPTNLLASDVHARVQQHANQGVKTELTLGLPDRLGASSTRLDLRRTLLRFARDELHSPRLLLLLPPRTGRLRTGAWDCPRRDAGVGLAEASLVAGLGAENAPRWVSALCDTVVSHKAVETAVFCLHSQQLQQ